LGFFGVFLENQRYDHLFILNSSNLSQNANIFATIFSDFFYINHNIDHRSRMAQDNQDSAPVSELLWKQKNTDNFFLAPL
jgi:hypothetical protein